MDPPSGDGHDAPPASSPPRPLAASEREVFPPSRWGLALLGGGCLVLLVSVVVVVVVASVLIGSIDIGNSGGGVGDPGTGAASQHLPVTVEPRTGLQEGSTVVVQSDAFRPSQVVGVTMCLREADTAHRGRDACDQGWARRYAVDAAGHLALTVKVPRVITVRGNPHDCARAGGACLLVVADVGDYDLSGGQPLFFAADLPPAALVAGPSRPASDRLLIDVVAGPVEVGAALEVTVHGLVPGEPVLVGFCDTEVLEADGAMSACEPLDGTGAAVAVMGGEVSDVADRAGPDGSFTTRLSVPGQVTPLGPTQDCTTRPGSCAVIVAAAADLVRSGWAPLTVEDR